MQQDVNYIEHLKNVNAKFYDDKLITSSHVAVYNSLFQFWNKSFFETDLSIHRDSVMKQAKIGSVNTYLKCLRELEKQGYLKYKASHNPLIGSIVNLFRFDTTPDKVVIKSNTSIDTTIDKAVIPYINIETIKPETLKLINDNASLVDEFLGVWINNHNISLAKETEKKNDSVFKWGDGVLESMCNEFKQQNPNKYPDDMYENFLEYWTAPLQTRGKKGKELWRDEKTFQLSSRLRTSYDMIWSKKMKAVTTPTDKRLVDNVRHGIPVN